MKDKDQATFTATINGLMVETYQREPLSAIGLSLWWNALREYELSDVLRALSAHVLNPDAGQWPPKPADIVKHLSGTGDARAFGAWAKCLRALASVGTYRTVAFDDPIIHAVVSDMGGWIEIGKITTDELPFRSAEFHRRYRAYMLAPPASYPRTLIGISDQHNAMSGHRITVPPVLIGDPQAAALVVERGAESTLQITQAPKSLLSVLSNIKKALPHEHEDQANR